MDWSLKWFEAISPSAIRTKKRRIGEKFQSVFSRKNVRCTPCLGAHEKCCSPKHKRTNQNVTFVRDSPRFIRSGNKAPSPEVVEKNFMKAYVVKSVEMAQYFQLLGEYLISFSIITFSFFRKGPSGQKVSGARCMFRLC